MIAYYKSLALTKRNINKFSFLANMGIGVNMLKYLNDSSVVYRLLQGASVELENTYNDIYHNIRFDYNKIPNNSIDAVNMYDLKLSSVYENDVVYLTSMYGYSKYTGNIYKLLGIQNEKEFTRCSYPCDIIFTESASGYHSFQEEELFLKEGLDNNINKVINNTRITIRPSDGFSRSRLSYVDDIMYIKITGYDTSNKRVEETISVEEYIDYKSEYTYSLIEKITSIGNKSTISIILYPYILGEVEVWRNKIIDREYADEYKAIATVDIQEKKLMFLRKLANQNGYPDTYDLEVGIDLEIENNETIYNYFIDSDDELLYLTTSANKLYCFPLIIPNQFDTNIDKLKTQKQAIKVSYINDEPNRQYIFTIQPIGKTNDVELLNIFINDVLYEQDILLDLYREGIEDNIIRISYDNLFSNEESIIQFETTGSNSTSLPIYLFKHTLAPLFTKSLNSITQYKDNNISTYSTDISSSTYFLDNFINTTRPIYRNPLVSNITITEDTVLKKISNSKNLIIGDYIISPVYNSFYFNKTDNCIVTHDSITGIRLDNTANKNTYNELNTVVISQNVNGLALLENEV